MLRAVLFHPTASVLPADDDRRNLDAGFGAGKLLGYGRKKLSPVAVSSIEVTLADN